MKHAHHSSLITIRHVTLNQKILIYKLYLQHSLPCLSRCFHNQHFLETLSRAAPSTVTQMQVVCSGDQLGKIISLVLCYAESQLVNFKYNQTQVSARQVLFPSRSLTFIQVNPISKFHPRKTVCLLSIYNSSHFFSVNPRSLFLLNGAGIDSSMYVFQKDCVLEVIVFSPDGW